MKKFTRITKYTCPVCEPDKTIEPKIVEEFTLSVRRVGEVVFGGRASSKTDIYSVFCCPNCGIVYISTKTNKLKRFEDTERVINIMKKYTPVKMKSSFQIFPKRKTFADYEIVYIDEKRLEKVATTNFFLTKDSSEEITGVYNVYVEKRLWQESFMTPIEAEAKRLLGKKSEAEIATATAFLKEKLKDNQFNYHGHFKEFYYSEQIQNPEPFEMPENLIPAQRIYLFDHQTLEETEYFIALDALEEIPEEE